MNRQNAIQKTVDKHFNQVISDKGTVLSERAQKALKYYKTVKSSQAKKADNPSA